MLRRNAPKASQKPLQNHYSEVLPLYFQQGWRSPKPHIQVRFLAGAPLGKPSFEVPEP
jgi:hypothetical protein